MAPNIHFLLHPLHIYRVKIHIRKISVFSQISGSKCIIFAFQSPYLCPGADVTSSMNNCSSSPLWPMNLVGSVNRANNVRFGRNQVGSMNVGFCFESPHYRPNVLFKSTFLKILSGSCQFHVGSVVESAVHFVFNYRVLSSVESAQCRLGSHRVQVRHIRR